ncbi:hypothetical protein HKD37_18G050928 [Glycine soja]
MITYTCSDAILPRKGPITRTMSKRLQEDWARAAEEGPRVLMNLRTHLLLEVASPLSLPSPFRCHLSSKKHRNPLMKKILGLQAPMELASCSLNNASILNSIHANISSLCSILGFIHFNFKYLTTRCAFR